MPEAFGQAEAGNMSPHLARLHGWAGWHSFQFVDTDDEAAFVEKDLAAMRQTANIICALQFLVLPYSLTPLGAESRLLLWPMSLIVLLQFYGRWKLQGSHYDDKWFSWFYTFTTVAMWILIVAVERLTGFAPIASDTVFVVLFFVFSITQALLALQVLAYALPRLVAACMVFSLISALHLYLYATRRPDTTEALAEQTMAPLAFWSLFILEMVFAAAFVQLSLSARRQHHAELEFLADRLRCEKERLNFDLALAHKKHQRASRAGSDGGSRGRRQGSTRSCESSAWSSGMEELAEGVADAREMQLMRTKLEEDAVESQPELGAKAAPSSMAVVRQQREAVLWKTLEDVGIRPHSTDLL